MKVLAGAVSSGLGGTRAVRFGTITLKDLLVSTSEGERESESGASAPEAGDLAPGGVELPRVLGRIEGAEPGPTLLLVGSLHGNEPAGALGLRRVFEQLAEDPRGIDRGRAVGLAGNLKALARKQRYLVDDLNRHWAPERVERLRATEGPLEAEDEELRELDREIRKVQRETEGELYFLDLHTTSGPDLPFANLDDTLRNRAFAFELPVPVVLGIEEELANTLATYLGGQGVITAGFEAGQHDDPRSVDRAEAAIWIAIEAAGLVRRGSRPEVAAARRRLASEVGSVPHVVEVRFRHPIEPEDWFRMDPGWANFQRVRKGQSLAADRRGAVRAPERGLILMPLYQQQGAEGFFLVRPVRPFWLKASARLRRTRLHRFLHLLPGVERHPEVPDAFVVDRHTARWLARELFHLFGFRRMTGSDDRYLVLFRREHDLL